MVAISQNLDEDPRVDEQSCPCGEFEWPRRGVGDQIGHSEHVPENPHGHHGFTIHRIKIKLNSAHAQILLHSLQSKGGPSIQIVPELRCGDTGIEDNDQNAHDIEGQVEPTVGDGEDAEDTHEVGSRLDVGNDIRQVPEPSHAKI